jgi:hypothetical protein
MAASGEKPPRNYHENTMCYSNFDALEEKINKYGTANDKAGAIEQVQSCIKGREASQAYYKSDDANHNRAIDLMYVLRNIIQEYVHDNTFFKVSRMMISHMQGKKRSIRHHYELETNEALFETIPIEFEYKYGQSGADIIQYGIAPPYQSKYNKLPDAPLTASRYMTKSYKGALAKAKAAYAAAYSASMAPASASMAPASASMASMAAVAAPPKKQKTRKQARAATPPPRSLPHVPLAPRAATPPPSTLRATASEFKSMLTPNATLNHSALKKGGTRRKRRHRK